MMVFGVLLSLLLPLAVVGFAARFVMHRMGSDAPVARTLGAALHVAVVVAVVNAVSGLLELLFRGDELFRDTPRLVAMNVAVLVVGVPVAFVIWRTLFSVGEDFPRRFAIVGGLSIALVTTVFSSIQVARSIFGLTDLDPSAIGDLLAFGAAWIGYEWWMRRREDRDFEVDDLPATVGSAAGLGLSVAALVLLIETALSSLLDTTGVLVYERPAADALLMVLIMAVVGGATLARYWVLDLHTRETRFRNGYGAIVSYLSLTALAASTGSIVFVTLEWLFGTGPDTAAEQFESLPITAGIAAAAGLTWWHHLGTIHPRRGLGQRAYSYGTAATGALAAASGLAALVVLALESVSTRSGVVASDAGTVVIAGVTALVIGALLWWTQWRRIDPREQAERESMPRRVYLVGLLVVAGIAGGVSLIAAIYGLLQAVLEGRLGIDVVFDGRFVIATVVVTAPLIWHIIGELREDRILRPAGTRHRRAIIVTEYPDSFAGLDDVAVLKAGPNGGGRSPVELAGQIERLLSEEGPPLLVVVKGDSFDAIELEEIPASGRFGIFD